MIYTITKGFGLMSTLTVRDEFGNLLENRLIQTNLVPNFIDSVIKNDIDAEITVAVAA